LTLSRNAWVGTTAAIAMLLAMKDFRLLAALPFVAVLTIGLAGSTVNDRIYSMFNREDATRLDRVAMLREGTKMIEAHPLVGVGPDMVKRLYDQYRVEGAVAKVNPHLHNVPVQIAAERGIPALLAWLAFIGLLTRDLAARSKRGEQPVATAAALAAVVAMLTGGLFEYNFGDSEFLMLFLLIVTLPSAVGQPHREQTPPYA
jgi:putative inorganic carbon (HCO3(-)) transporter